MASFAYYRFFPGDYYRDTRHLSILQHGAYRMLIDLYMDRGSLPNNLEMLYRSVGAMSVEEKGAVEYILAEFFILDGPLWRHKRCDQERAYSEDRSEKAKKSIAVRYERKAQELRTYYERTTIQNQNQIQNQKDLKDYSPIGELSGKPDPAPPENQKTRELRRQAGDVLDYLNANTGKSFKRVDANLDMIVARLKEGYTPVELKEIAFYKTREWGTDEKMAEYLRPKTLYNRTNCAQYHGEHCQPAGGENEVS